MTHAPGHNARGKRDNPRLWATLDAEAKAKKAGGGPAVSEDASSLLASLGVTNLGGGGYQDPDDPVVIVSRTTPNPDQFGPGSPLNVPQRKKMSEALKDFYRLKGNDLVRMQARLFRAGFYPGDVDFDDIDAGNHDEDTYKAYERAVGRAAQFSDAGEDVSLDDILDKPSPKAGAAARAGRERGPVKLTNPDDIIRGVEKIAREAVGHKLTDAQRAAAVTTWQQLERQYSSALEAGMGGGEVVAPPEFSTFAEDFAEKADPQGAFRQDAIEGMNEFYDLLDGTNG